MATSMSSGGGALDVGHIGIAMADLPPFDRGRLDLRAWFGDTGSDAYARPIDLEIGSGKGTFLVGQAKYEPGVNFIGIEYARAYWRHAADRLRRHGLDNVRMVHGEAGAFVRQYVVDGALRQVHIYFPDPWPKKRHHKRRLVQAPFLRELHRVLAPGGQVRLATDHEDYFAWMGEHAAKVAELFERRPFERPAAAGAGELVGTNFERKYRDEGRTFQGMTLHRLD